MIYTTQVPHLEKEVRSSVTLGKFDGLHRGHQKLINLIRREQGEKNRSVIFTFDVSPRSYILHSPPKYLLTYEERRELAENLGVDILAECPFTEALMHMEPEDFVKEYLAERLHARYLAVGPDFRFGYQRRGTPELLKELGRTYGFRTEIVEKEKYKGRDISSTFVREELEKGHTYTVAILKDGYRTTYANLVNKVGGGWIVLDILAGLIPIVVDAVTGAWGSVSPNSVHAILTPAT